MSVITDTKNWKMDVHADDYALSMNVSREIIQCIKDGKIDSISVLPNMSCFEDAVKLLKEQVSEEKMPRYSVHLNVMEGHCLADPEQVSELVDEKGFFKVSWGSLFLDSFRFGRRRNRMKEQLKTEIKLQIERVRDSLYPGRKIRIDSHQHSHMVPVVFDALAEVIREEQYALEYIRVPEEPQWPFFKNFCLWPTYSPVNAVKNLILNAFSKRNRRVIRAMGLPHNLLWGLMFSGMMDRRRVERLWTDMARYVERRERTLEIVFHPGRMFPDEIGEEYVKEGFVEFHLSEARDIEKEAVYWTSEKK